MVDNEMKPFGYLRKFTLGPKGDKSAKSPFDDSKGTFSMIFKVPVITFDLKMTLKIMIEILGIRNFLLETNSVGNHINACWFSKII